MKKLRTTLALTALAKGLGQPLGKLQALAVSTARRSSLLPDVPSTVEAGARVAQAANPKTQ